MEASDMDDAMLEPLRKKLEGLRQQKESALSQWLQITGKAQRLKQTQATLETKNELVEQAEKAVREAQASLRRVQAELEQLQAAETKLQEEIKHHNIPEDWENAEEVADYFNLPAEIMLMPEGKQAMDTMRTAFDLVEALRNTYSAKQVKKDDMQQDKAEDLTGDLSDEDMPDVPDLHTKAEEAKRKADNIKLAMDCLGEGVKEEDLQRFLDQYEAKRQKRCK